MESIFGQLRVALDRVGRTGLGQLSARLESQCRASVQTYSERQVRENTCALTRCATGSPTPEADRRISTHAPRNRASTTSAET